jgi:pimeloyl-ACP methyl ester carboxylesterase
MPTVGLNGIEVYHELHGDGPPLLLVAGLASDSQSWLPVRDALAERFRLVLVDNRGCGRTTPQDAPLSVPQMADDCAALLDALGIPRAHVLGHSMGGMIALDLAARHGARVERLVLAGTGAATARTATVMGDLAAARETGMPPELWFRLLFPWLFRPGFFEYPETVAEAARLSAAYPYPQSDAAFRAQFEASRAYRGHAAAAAAVRAPTLVLNASLDLLMTPADADRTFAAIPQRRSAVLEGAAHSMHWDKPREFVREVLAFLEAP